MLYPVQDKQTLIRDLRYEGLFPDDRRTSSLMFLSNLIFGKPNESATTQIINGRDKDIIRRMLNKTPTNRPHIAEVKRYIQGKFILTYISEMSL